MGNNHKCLMYPIMNNIYKKDYKMSDVLTMILNRFDQMEKQNQDNTQELKVEIKGFVKRVDILERFVTRTKTVVATLSTIITFTFAYMFNFMKEIKHILLLAMTH